MNLKNLKIILIDLRYKKNNILDLTYRKITVKKFLIALARLKTNKFNESNKKFKMK